ncbi:hypothetical protein CR513_36427, partial [Mucuna pruriens]
MLNLGASINVMPNSIYKSLNFANRSVVQPLGVLEDVLVQVNELIFPANFYVLDMEDETSRKGSTLILGRPFLMNARTNIDVHVGTLSMEFGDTLVQFNIFEAMNHPIEDHLLFGIDLIDEITAAVKIFQIWQKILIHNLSNFEEDNIDLVDVSQKAELINLLYQVCKYENPKCSNKAKAQVAETGRLFPTQVATIFTIEYELAKRSRDREKTEVISAKKTGVKADPHPDPKESNDNSSSPPPPMGLKPLPSHLKYAYLDAEQQLSVIIGSNLRWEQENKLLSILRQHKKAIGINPSICMHRILMEEEAKPIRQQQRRMNPTILCVVKKEVTKLLVVGIIYPISDSQWVTLVQVVPKKSRMTVTKNQHDELVPMWIQNSWRVCIDFRRLNQATRKDHFPLSFIDQVLDKLVGKSHYFFLDGFSGYMQIHIAPEDQYKTTFTYPFGTFAYTRMPFGLCNVPSTFQRCMTSIFSDLL